MLEGSIDVAVGEERHHLEEGDCLAMDLDGPVDVLQPDDGGGALRDRGDARPTAAGDDRRTHDPPRRCASSMTRRSTELADVLIDCVAGGASFSFMDRLTREQAVAFWRGVAQGVAAGERALLVAEDGQGVCGTVQLVLAQPENQPHRADLSKMLVHRRARRQGLGAALMRAAEASRANAARRCWCSTPSPAATPHACTSAWAGSASARSPAMRSTPTAGRARRRSSTGGWRRPDGRQRRPAAGPMP